MSRSVLDMGTIIRANLFKYLIPLTCLKGSVVIISLKHRLVRANIFFLQGCSRIGKESQVRGKVDTQYWPIDEFAQCQHVCRKYACNILILKPTTEKTWTLGDRFQNVVTYCKPPDGGQKLLVIILK